MITSLNATRVPQPDKSVNIAVTWSIEPPVLSTLALVLWVSDEDDGAAVVTADRHGYIIEGLDPTNTYEIRVGETLIHDVQRIDSTP